MYSHFKFGFNSENDRHSLSGIDIGNRGVPASYPPPLNRPSPYFSVAPLPPPIEYARPTFTFIK